MDDGAAHAIAKADAMLAETYETAHPVAGGGDFDRARAVLDGDAAEEVPDESSHTGLGIRICGCVGSVNISVDMKVAELGTACHGRERSYELGIDGCLGTAIVEGQRVAAVGGATQLGVAAVVVDGEVAADVVVGGGELDAGDSLIHSREIEL